MSNIPAKILYHVLVYMPFVSTLLLAIYGYYNNIHAITSTFVITLTIINVIMFIMIAGLVKKHGVVLEKYEKFSMAWSYVSIIVLLFNMCIFIYGLI